MTNAKHTPGPWVRNDEAPKIIMSGSSIEGHQGYMIGSVTGNDNSGFYASEKEAEANARLIVSAPDLLVALEGLLIAYNDPGNTGSTHDDKVKAARAAIDKARGES